MTSIENNKKIAEFIGWTYIPYDEKDKTFTPGWYRKQPKVNSPKINGGIYIGRTHNCLNFQYDMNLLFEAVEYLESIGKTITVTTTGNKSRREIYYETVLSIIDNEI